jgi:hypothetical protein
VNLCVGKEGEKRYMVAVIEQKNPAVEEHRRFVPLWVTTFTTASYVELE